MLTTLRLPTRILMPFLVMIVLSFLTPPVDKSVLDRYYVKMKTPVDPDRDSDRRQLDESYRDPGRLDGRRLLPFFGLEFQRPRPADAIGVVVCFAICFLFVGLAMWLASLGG